MKTAKTKKEIEKESEALCLSHLMSIGLKPISPPGDLLERAWELIPHKMRVIRDCPVGIVEESLLDQIGIDALMEYEGKLYAIDVTTSAHAASCKVKHLADIDALLQNLGAAPLVIRWSPMRVVPRSQEFSPQYKEAIVETHEGKRKKKVCKIMWL